MKDVMIRITPAKLRTLAHDPVKSAAAVKLIYMTDAAPGIARIKKNDTFLYTSNGRRVTSKEQLNRIKSLVIPPAWEQVWICPIPEGHLQATGLDAKNRKQYRYHPLWNSLRNQTKFYHLSDFGRSLPEIRERLQKDISKQGLSLQKVLATIVMLMQNTCIRIGNSVYEKLYGSFGLTTLKDKHVQIDGEKLRFSFKGKKGVKHDIHIRSRKLAHIVKQCRDIPGQELFQYYDKNGDRKSVDSGMVNAYIKDISGGHFTAKDFRTWAGSLHALEAFRDIGCSDTVTETKKGLITALDRVAKQLGNTRSVCRKYYIHPLLIAHYTNNTIAGYWSQGKAATDGLSADETILMRILNDSAAATIA